MLEAKPMIQPSSSGNCEHLHSIEILNPFNPLLQLINTKPMIQKQIKTC